MTCLTISLQPPFGKKTLDITHGSYYFTFLRASRKSHGFSLKGYHPGFILGQFQRLSFSYHLIFTSALLNRHGRRNAFSNNDVSDEKVSCCSDKDGGTEMKNVAESCSSDKMIRNCDKLIEVFMVDKQNPSDWRILLAFSKEWNDIRAHFYRRCQERAAVEDDPAKKHALFRLGRKLKEVDEDVRRHDHLLNLIRDAPSEIHRLVSERRMDFTKDFFTHFHNVVESCYNDPTQRDALLKIRSTCVACLEAFDMISGEKPNTPGIIPALNLQDVAASPFSNPPSSKIDKLTEKNRLDSSLTQMLTKAWSSAEETDMTENEAKDTLYHLYKISMGNLQRLMPKELRIMRHLLTIEDPEVLHNSLREAFTPGREVEGDDVDILYTTPEKLHQWMKHILDAYSDNREKSLVKEARELTSPGVIEKTVDLCSFLEKNFL